ncbi:hypothetical protein [Aliidiomarina sp.]|uniref:hypothetical protein n=1 Tax=Aliidiomarina sp. TaxID=1872439 RepID=UPI003A4D7629
MRIWLVFITMCSLLLLPFSGNGSVLPDTHGEMHGTSFGSSHSVSSHSTSSHSTSSHNTAHDTTHVSALAEPEVAEAAHCNLIAAKLEKASVVEIPELEQHTNMDCCDDDTDCAPTCAANCGHCVGVGHGCSAIAAFVKPFLTTTVQDSVAFSLSNYSLLLVHASKPPIIA